MSRIRARPWTGCSIPVPVAADLRAALLKVYRHKDLSLELAVSAACQFAGDRADLMEMLGNLLDNACKWCAQRVRLTVEVDPAGAVAGEHDDPCRG